jgi:hypothetical protein
VLPPAPVVTDVAPPPPVVTDAAPPAPVVTDVAPSVAVARGVAPPVLSVGREPEPAPSEMTRAEQPDATIAVATLTKDTHLVMRVPDSTRGRPGCERPHASLASDSFAHRAGARECPQFSNSWRRLATSLRMNGWIGGMFDIGRWFYWETTFCRDGRGYPSAPPSNEKPHVQDQLNPKSA